MLIQKSGSHSVILSLPRDTWKVAITADDSQQTSIFFVATITFGLRSNGRSSGMILDRVGKDVVLTLAGGAGFNLSISTISPSSGTGSSEARSVARSGSDKGGHPNRFCGGGPICD